MSTRPTTPSLSETPDRTVSNSDNTIDVEPRVIVHYSSAFDFNPAISSQSFQQPYHNNIHWPPPSALTIDHVPDNDFKHDKKSSVQDIDVELRSVKNSEDDLQAASNQRNLASRIMGILTTSFRTANLILIFIAAATICIIPDFIFVVYAFYYSYVEIFFNSPTAVHILRNNGTECAFKFFYWLICGAVVLPNFAIGFGLASLGYKCRKYLKLRYRFFLIWMMPWGAALLAITSISFWIRPIVRDAYQAHVFAHECATSGWDLDIILAASPTPTPPGPPPLTSSAVGTAIISFTQFPNTQYHLQLIRHLDDLNRFDFVPVPSLDRDVSTPPPPPPPLPFTNITYDWKNQTYSAWGGRNDTDTTTNVSGTYITQPNLSFPSLNVSLLDDSIPFQRSGYHTCWPSAATLVLRNLTSDDQYYQVLQTLTHKPHDVTQMKVCATMAVDEELQITLGVVFIDHFYFSSCVENGGAVYGAS